MKKKVTFFFCIVFLFSTYCLGQTWNFKPIMKVAADSTGGTTLSVSPTSLNFTALGEQQTFSITSDTSWNVLCSDSLRFKVSPASGSNNGTVTVTAIANSDTIQQTATITIYGAGVTPQTISVTQDAAAPPALTLSVFPTSLSFTASGEQQTFAITSNTNWNIVSSDSTWVNVSPASGSNNGTVTVTAIANSDTIQRTATITIYGTGVTPQTISVTQEAVQITPTLSVSTSLMNFAASGEKQTFTITSNTDWRVSCIDSAWVKISPISGSIDGIVSVITVANSDTIQRTATITVSGTGVTAQTISIIQNAVENNNVIPQTKPVSADGTGKIELSLSIPSDATLTGSFEITFPAGMTLDEDSTALVPELANNFFLSFTYEGNNTWMIEIISNSLRSSTAVELTKIMDIAYKVDEGVSKGEYESTITNLDFAMDDGSSIQENELPVILTVTNDVTSIGNIGNTLFYAYFINNSLRIESSQAETITIYSAAGVQLYSAKKSAGSIEIPFTSIQGAVYIIKGSVSGTIKVVK